MPLAEFSEHFASEAKCQAALESARLHQGVVVADATVLGNVHSGKRGRGSPKKAPFVAAVARIGDGRPQHVRSDANDDFAGDTIAAWAESARHPEAHLVHMGLASFAASGAVVAAHGSIIVRPRKSGDLEPFRWVNTVIGNVNTAIRAPSTISTSISTAVATWARPNTASTVTSTCRRWSGRWRMPAFAPARAPKSGCGWPGSTELAEEASSSLQTEWAQPRQLRLSPSVHTLKDSRCAPLFPRNGGDHPPY